MNSLLDLDLNLYGKFWENLPNYFFQLKLAYNETPMYSLLHNQNIYNSSKINLSISHPQCNGFTYPWRIFDIMASNGLLITSFSKLLKIQTKDVVDIPMYENPYQARDLCIYALKNPSYCEDIIAKSNLFIEKYGRWENNFKIIQEKLKISLLNTKNTTKEFKIYHITPKIIKKDKYHGYKNFTNGIALAFSSIPVINLFYTKKIKNKIIKSINKYNKVEDN